MRTLSLPANANAHFCVHAQQRISSLSLISAVLGSSTPVRSLSSNRDHKVRAVRSQQGQYGKTLKKLPQHKRATEESVAASAAAAPTRSHSTPATAASKTAAAKPALKVINPHAKSMDEKQLYHAKYRRRLELKRQQQQASQSGSASSAGASRPGHSVVHPKSNTVVLPHLERLIFLHNHPNSTPPSEYAIVLKPAGIPIQALSPTQDSVELRLRTLYKCRNVMFPHRLDKHTSGILCVAFTQRANARMSEDLRENRWLKKYRLVAQLPQQCFAQDDDAADATTTSSTTTEDKESKKDATASAVSVQSVTPPHFRVIDSVKQQINTRTHPHLIGALYKPNSNASNKSTNKSDKPASESKPFALYKRGTLTSHIARRDVAEHAHRGAQHEIQAWRQAVNHDSQLLVSQQPSILRRTSKFAPVDESEVTRQRLVHPYVPETMLFLNCPKQYNDNQKEVKHMHLKSAKRAVSRFELTHINAQHHLALYEAELLTGRSHQLRVHWAQADAPIVNDPYYNAQYVFTRFTDQLIHQQQQKNSNNSKKSKDKPLPQFDPTDSEQQLIDRVNRIETVLLPQGKEHRFDQQAVQLRIVPRDEAADSVTAASLAPSKHQLKLQTKIRAAVQHKVEQKLSQFEGTEFEVIRDVKQLESSAAPAQSPPQLSMFEAASVLHAPQTSTRIHPLGTVQARAYSTMTAARSILSQPRFTMLMSSMQLLRRFSSNDSGADDWQSLLSKYKVKPASTSSAAAGASHRRAASPPPPPRSPRPDRESSHSRPDRSAGPLHALSDRSKQSRRDSPASRHLDHRRVSASRHDDDSHSHRQDEDDQHFSSNRRQSRTQPIRERQESSPVRSLAPRRDSQSQHQSESHRKASFNSSQQANNDFVTEEHDDNAGLEDMDDEAWNDESTDEDQATHQHQLDLDAESGDETAEYNAQPADSDAAEAHENQSDEPPMSSRARARMQRTMRNMSLDKQRDLDASMTHRLTLRDAASDTPWRLLPVGHPQRKEAEQREAKKIPQAGAAGFMCVNEDAQVEALALQTLQIEEAHMQKKKRTGAKDIAVYCDAPAEGFTPFRYRPHALQLQAYFLSMPDPLDRTKTVQVELPVPAVWQRLFADANKV